MAKRANTVRIQNGFSTVEVRADTFNEGDRTVEIVWAAGAQVKRYSWDEGYYMEELSMDPKAIRLDRFAAGMSLLDSHSHYSMESRLGTVVPGSVRIEAGKAYAKIKLSRKPRAEELFQDLRDGHSFPVSVGYKTHAYEKREGDSNSLPILRAIDWEPMELSAVPVPADSGAHSRSENGETYDVVIRNGEHPTTANETADALRVASIKELPMTKREAAKKYVGDQLNAFAMGYSIVRASDETDDALRVRLLAAIEAQEAAESAQRSAQETETRRLAGETEAARAAAASSAAASAAAAAAGAATADDTAARNAVSIERTRIADVQALGARHGIDAAIVSKAVSDGTDAVDFGRKVLDILAERSDDGQISGVAVPRGGQDERSTRRAAVVNAMLHRCGIIPADKLTDAAREWRGMTSMDIAKDLLRAQGESARGSVNEIAQRAFHSTSDFPIIMGEVTRATMLSGYEGYANTFGLISSRNVVPDFRELKTLELGSAPDLLPVGENGEFKAGTMKESQEAFKIDTYGRTIGFSRQMLINDQLNAFTKAIAAWGSKAAKLEGDITWGVIISNAKLKDNKGLFHADHGNLGTAAALGVASLKAARLAFRKQTDIDGELINLTPTYLFVGSELEISAVELIKSQFIANQLTSATPEFIKSLTVVYEPRIDEISQYAWLLFASPQQTNGRGLQHAFLSGQEAPFFDERVGFEVDGIEYKIRHDFGAGLTDYRFAYKNPGLAPT
ncbi:hypothetical protein GA830_10570 [Mesorhizobium sp. NBSH29]|uniref:prohead protease/major capsid protein fusion protein n=1 Tax=Mesorhizobium sp. NBSH29 TaxID=2654249 RepID=UPI001896A240|nr:prohead protease/major capsid protein fusion protein [Mesorhizobium sp. NBSH29]QPC87137.1 hypothetical protein GA830_10570 [Mesorhizobium sp. NBSH29]